MQGRNLLEAKQENRKRASMESFSPFMLHLGNLLTLCGPSHLPQSMAVKQPYNQVTSLLKTKQNNNNNSDRSALSH